MAITYPITLPTTPGFVEFKRNPVSAVVVQRSEFTFVSKAYAWEGQTQTFTCKLPKMPLATARLWQAAFLSLNGPEGTFYLKEPTAATKGGSATGPGAVKGASQNGSDVITDGWATGVTGLFKTGDWISIANRLHQVLADANSNGSGECTLRVFPFVRRPADNAVILVGSAAQGIFRLADKLEFVTDIEKWMTGFTFVAEEAF